ncbi:14565_t:CDS:1, partial [Dentiscutata heterogama]
RRYKDMLKERCFPDERKNSKKHILGLNKLKKRETNEAVRDHTQKPRIESQLEVKEKRRANKKN